LPNAADILATTQQEQGASLFGQRQCPNAECRAHIFFAADSNGGKVYVSYPHEVIDFDSSNLPTSVVKALNEAVVCHSQECFTAAAIMIRKTLEELCHERGVTGSNLKERIAALRSKVIISQELIEGLDNLRLLGNDAAHIEAQVFNEVGQEEVELAIDVTKEVLKSVYQHASLVARLQALKKTCCGYLPHPCLRSAFEWPIKPRNSFQLRFSIAR